MHPVRTEQAIKAGMEAQGRTVPQRIEEAVVYWPTVHGNLGNNGPSGTELGSAVNQASAWPTPAARDVRSGLASQETMNRNSRPLNEVVTSGQPVQDSPNTPGKPRGSLNSQWVAQLMGWPDEYVQRLTRACCEFWETVGCRKSQK
jgi:hypothetical protein